MNLCERRRATAVSRASCVDGQRTAARHRPHRQDRVETFVDRTTSAHPAIMNSLRDRISSASEPRSPRDRHPLAAPRTDNLRRT